MNNEGLTPRHYFTVVRRNLASGNKRALNCPSSVGFISRTGYQNPPRGPDVVKDLEYMFSGIEPPQESMTEFLSKNPPSVHKIREGQ